MANGGHVTRAESAGASVVVRLFIITRHTNTWEGETRDNETLLMM